MSQTAPGEAGGGGNASHSSNKFFQQPFSAPVGTHFFSQGQGGADYGPLIPHFPVKPTNPHMGNPYRPHGPMQFNMHSSHLNSPQEAVHQFSMKPRNDVSAAMSHPYQQNYGNVQYFPSGNYVAAVAVSPEQQQQQQQQQQQHPPKQVIHPSQQQYMHNPQNYYTNCSASPVMTQMNTNMYMQNMFIPQNVNKNTYVEDENCQKSKPISESILISEKADSDKSFTQEIKSLDNSDSFNDENTSLSKINSECFSGNSNETIGSNVTLQNIDESSQKVGGNSSSVSGNRNSSINSSSTHQNNCPRTTSRCDSVRSEAGESTCSSLSTESISTDQNLVPHHNQHVVNVKNNQNYPFVNQHYINNQLQSANFSTTNNNNGSVTYQNYVPCQSRMNQVIGKPGMYNNSNLIQAFQQVNTVQHVQVQHGQVQIMQQHYQSLQGPGVARQTLGIIPNHSIPQGQPNSVIVSMGNNSVQGMNIPNSGMITDVMAHDQNSPMAQTCINHSGMTGPPQNFSASTPHGQFLHHSVIPPQCKGPRNLMQQTMIGMTGSVPGAGNPVNKVFPTIVVVPFGWKRLNDNGQIVYVSPSGSELRSPMEVCDYLTQENTCKCGLQCPLRVENIFCFDPKVPHRLTTPEELSSGEATKSCAHRRKLALAFSHHLQKHAKREDGRKKRKRKTADSVENPSSLCSTVLDETSSATQFIPFNPHMQHPDPSKLPQQPQQPQPQQQQPQQQQQQQQQQQMYPHNQNQNWNGMYGGPRMMLANGGMHICQGSQDGYSNMSPSQGCPPATPYGNQHSQNCCDNHQCYNNHRSKMVHHSMRPAFGGINRPPFCRMPGMLNNQGGCIPQQPMQQFLQHQMMLGNRAPMPIINNPICRLPMNASHMQMFDGGNMSQGSECQMGGQDASLGAKASQPEEGEKRRRGTSSRSRKKVKPSVDTNSPSLNIDARNLRTENTISPHTGPGPPSLTPSAVTPHNSTDSYGEVSSNVSGASQGLVSVSGPSFMEDPNGYLAQQTVLLNNTMSGGGVGQFSPQGSRLSPRPSVSVSQSNPSLSSKAHQTFGSSTPQAASTTDPKPHASPAVVPLPSNVPLPARVSKAINSPALTSTSSAAASPSGSLCASVQSKSWSSCMNNSISRSKAEDQQEKSKALIATAESSCGSHTVTVTYTTSSVTTTTCDSNSPHSSHNLDMHTDTTSTLSELSCMNETQTSTQNIKLPNTFTSITSNSSEKLFGDKAKSVDQRKKSDVPMTSGSGMTIISSSSSGPDISIEAANKPLTPGPAESTIATQSPLEMVQNIVSSIPLPASTEDLTPLPGKLPSHQNSYSVPEQSQSLQSNLPIQQQVTGHHLYNMTGGSGMTGVMYNAGGAPSMFRGPGQLVLHGATPTGSIPPGVLVSNSGNMVVVTSPFNTKVSMAAPVACSNVSGITSMVGVQAVPQMQVQSPIASVQSHQLQSHLQQIQPVQPVVQFVNTFATMQTPVIIQNGSNIIQSPSGVISGHGGVIGPASIIPSSQAFVTSQPLLAVDSSSHSSHVQMTHVVTPASSDGSEDNSINRLTPVATPASTPTTPYSTPGSETSPSGSSSGSGRKRKRRRNISTPQNAHQQSPQQQQHIVPAIIMGKQLPQQMVVNGSQISQAAHYGATVAAMGGNGTASSSGSQMLATAGQPTNSINVVQMVGGPVAGPLPVHLQHPHTILVPSAATSGVIINQLPDGTFVSTDPSSGVTYPVQLQLSGSHIVGVTPVGNSNLNSGIVSSITTPSVPQTTVVAVRPSHNPSINSNAKLISISSGVSSSHPETLMNSVYGMSTCPSVPNPGIITAPVETNYHNNTPTFTQHHLQQPNQPEGTALHPSVMVANANASLLQRKTTTIVAQQTTVVATQGGLLGTHSSVSTQTPGLLGESDVTSSDCVAAINREARDVPESPSHQSAEVTTTRQDEDVSTPESVLVSPQGQSSPESSLCKKPHSKTLGQRQEPHSATAASTVWW